MGMRPSVSQGSSATNRSMADLDGEAILMWRD